MEDVKKVLILGSGGLCIGQAGEFDYSGSQAIKALQEEGIYTVLVNPNIATIQTSKGLADKVYFLPITPEFVEKIIEKEKPDGLLLSFGGQTALNCGVELYRNKILEKHNVKVLGTPVDAIITSEDRDLFAQLLREINVSTPPSIACHTVEEAISAAEKIGYPVILRAAYALGGLGSGFSENEGDLKELAKSALAKSPQVLIEKSLKGWKEIEYEVVRDKHDNCITVCNMENFDPLGIHTGESIVIAPSQTLDNTEYNLLRNIAIKVIRRLGVVGECNIQYALDPVSHEYYVIEVNARLSRSSALASKATGYPLAFVAAKLALGYDLNEIRNSITKVTAASFEPALDYVVLKFPRWDLDKFKGVSREIGTSMKSVGEVMAIGRTFEEILQKAIRMVGTQFTGIVGNTFKIEDIDKELTRPSDKRVFAIAQAFEQGYTVEKVYGLTKIDRWFLSKIKHIVDLNKKLLDEKPETVSTDLLKEAKVAGFSDRQIAQSLLDKETVTYDEVLFIRGLRKDRGIIPSIKQIDTLAAEYPAQTNYLYMTYSGSEDDVGPTGPEGIVVLGSGAYRIGSSVEFDWCCVDCVTTLRELGHKTIMINHNPETVSTDYDTCDKLYFEELSFERVLDIYEKENPNGVIVSMGGQIPNNLAMPLSQANVKILGTKPTRIDMAENRHKFSKLLDEYNIDQPEWKELSTMDEATQFAERVGFPVLVRPSYVLSGAAMNVAHSSEQLVDYLKQAADVSPEHPVVITKFLLNAKEIEVDAVAKNGTVVCYAISEHVENAGVHSGDATLVLPPQNLYVETIRRITNITKNIAEALHITGPFNVQYLARDNEIKVIECNLRASRSFPFVSKVLKKDFIATATKAILEMDVKPMAMDILNLNYVGVKAPQFSFTRLHSADPVLGVEMTSTGEVACLGENIYEAFLKSLISTGFKIPEKNILLSTGPTTDKARLLEAAQKFSEQGYNLFATKGTAEHLRQNGIPSATLHWPSEPDLKPNVLDYLKEKKLDLVINIPKNFESEELNNNYLIRRMAVDYGIPLITNRKCTTLLAESLSRLKVKDLAIKSWDEY